MKRMIITNQQEALDELKKFDFSTFSIDTETVSLEDKTLLGISLCNDEANLYLVFKHGDKSYLSPQIYETFIKHLSFNGLNKRIVAHNIVFDYKVLLQVGIDIESYEWFDTMIADHLINENRKHGLKDLVREIFEIDLPSWEQTHNKPLEEFGEYALNDTYYTWKLMKYQLPILKDEELVFLFRDIEMPFLRCIAEMELTGIKVDLDKVNATSELIGKELLKMEEELYKILDEPYEFQMDCFGNVKELKSKISFNSNQQLGNILFNRLGLPIIERTEKGMPKTENLTLKALRNKHPFVKELIKYKIAQKLQNAFFNPLPELTDNDGRVRTSFHDTGTVTGRLSSSKPNCLKDDTEVLVLNKGWVLGKDITLSDSIATYNEDKNIIEYQKPLQLIKGTTPSGYSFKNEHIDIVCTDNHRHLLYNRKNNKKYVVDSKHFMKDTKILNASIYTNKDEVDGWLQRIVAAIQADAHVVDGTTFDFKFTKKRKYDRLKELLNGFNYKYYSNNNVYRIYFKPESSVLEEISLFLDLETKKFHPRIIHEFGDTFFNELRYWDGLSTREWGERYCSVIEYNVDIVQALCTLRGFRSLKSKDKFRISVSNTNYSLTSNIEITTVNGFNYWCATTPNDTLLIRRNGKIVITKNCQQLPKSKEDFPIDTRGCFIVDKGKKLVAIDYSQQELRVMTHLTKEPAMIRAFKEGLDLHLYIANKVFNLGIPDEYLYESNPNYNSIKKKYKVERDKGKSFSFGIPYGMGAQGMASRLNVSKDEAQRLLDIYYSEFVNVKSTIDKVRLDAERYGYVKTFTGRRRRFEKNQYGKLDNRSIRQSFNFLIQSFGADLIRIACNKLYRFSKRHPECEMKLLLTVHDEIVFECKEEYAERLTRYAEKVMASCANLIVPLLAEGHYGDTYGDIK